jgi:hypothetical protein
MGMCGEGRGGDGEPPDANKEVVVETPAEETLPS